MEPGGFARAHTLVLMFSVCPVAGMSAPQWSLHDRDDSMVRPPDFSAPGAAALAPDHGDALGLSAAPPRATTGRAGEECPPGALCGQDHGPCGTTQWYFYSDLEFCNPAPAPCQRVRCENFPPPGVTIDRAIGAVAWRGVYVDDATNGCVKPQHLFRVQFYADVDGAPDTAAPVYSDNIVATAVDTGDTVVFAAVPATLWEFTAILNAPVGLTSGWFTVAGHGRPGCYFLWAGSNEGDSKFYQWYEIGGTIPGPPVTDRCDLVYCLHGWVGGACCDDRTMQCVENTSEFYCSSIGGRFQPETPCAALTPPCGEALGACCFDDGTCELTVFRDCESPPTPRCLGDINCDGGVDVFDINAWQLLCYSFREWVLTYPDCDPLNADLNCDGIWCGEGDLGAFVACLSQNPLPIPCPPGCGDCGSASRVQGSYWAGWGTTCEPWPAGGCCTVVVPPGAWLETEPEDCAPSVYSPVCVGDLNCDGTINFKDINPFVLYLTDLAAWRGQYGDCNLRNGDVNCDSLYGQGAFGDINPFVALLVEHTGAACPGPVVCDGASIVDVFNGGCGSYPPVFSPLSIGQTIYGESGTTSIQGSPYADADWYRFETSTASFIQVAVTAEFAPRVQLYLAGDGVDECAGAREIAAPVTGPRCADVALNARCMLPGAFYLVITPAPGQAVRCGADYRLHVDALPATECCSISPCPTGSYIEGTATGHPGECDDDPNHPDPNGGCVTVPYAFEPLPLDPYAPVTVCGTVWALAGRRDSDWYLITLPLFTQVHWEVNTEVPIRATMLFSDLGGGTYGAPPEDCSVYYFWVDTLFTPCLPESFSSNACYRPGDYWFLVTPEDEQGPLLHGYPCPQGGNDPGSEYQVTLYAGPPPCPCDDHPHGNTESAEPLGPGYVDTYNSGCDAAAPPGPRLALGFEPVNAWLAHTGTWQESGVLQKDYDWYEITLTARRRFKVYLFADFPATWEIWPANNCAAGPIEGLDVPACYDAGIYTARCYPAGTFWLRVYPTGWADIGKCYYLALTEAGSCAPCAYSCAGVDLDGACDDAFLDDTNAGCDDPNAPGPHYMVFACGGTYCGRVSAQEINGQGYYDPDWFQITQTNATAKRFRLSVTAEFLAHVEAYASCSDYDAGTAIPGLDAFTPLTLGTACPSAMVTSTSTYPQGTTIYGRFTAVDQFGNLMLDYYPCAKGNNRWRIVVGCVN